MPAAPGWPTIRFPADQSSWDFWGELADRNRTILRGILEKASVNDPQRSPVEQKIGDFYASCMDEPAINKLGARPLEPELKRIDAIQSKAAILDALIQLHLDRRRRASSIFPPSRTRRIPRK